MDIQELQKKYKLSKDDFWELSQRKGTWIITHDACEKIATQEDIEFREPEVHIALDSICLIGKAWRRDDGEREIWSTGEASDVNVKMSGKYYWSMAEKRLKDRLILKLIKAYEYGIYSETEADGFAKTPAKPKRQSYSSPEALRMLEDTIGTTTAISELNEISNKLVKSTAMDNDKKAELMLMVNKRIDNLNKEF